MGTIQTNQELHISNNAIDGLVWIETLLDFHSKKTFGYSKVIVIKSDHFVSIDYSKIGQSIQE